MFWVGIGVHGLAHLLILSSMQRDGSIGAIKMRVGST